MPKVLTPESMKNFKTRSEDFTSYKSKLAKDYKKISRLARKKHDLVTLYLAHECYNAIMYEHLDVLSKNNNILKRRLTYLLKQEEPFDLTEDYKSDRVIIDVTSLSEEQLVAVYHSDIDRWVIGFKLTNHEGYFLYDSFCSEEL
jgi:predicted nucleic acid-binding protein